MSAVRIRLTLIIFLAAGVVAPSRAWGQTHVFGGDIGGQAWTSAGSPYLIWADVRVPAGSFLNIDPGTVVAFMDTDLDGTGLDPTRVEFTVAASASVWAIGAPDAYPAATLLLPYFEVSLEDRSLALKVCN